MICIDLASLGRLVMSAAQGYEIIVIKALVVVNSKRHYVMHF
jgi:hypothetical protein